MIPFIVRQKEKTKEKNKQKRCFLTLELVFSCVFNGFSTFLFFLFFTQYKVPKLFTPAVACPKCAYANDENSRFYQRCWYARRHVFVPDPHHRDEIDYRNHSLPLAIPGRRILCRRSLRVFCLVYHPLSLAFLVWKDRNGKTLVHLRDCVIVYGLCTLQVYCTLVAVPGTLRLEQWTP